MRRTAMLVSMVLAVAMMAMAGIRDDIKKNPLKGGSHYFAYPDSALPALTPAPEGYKPFFINHYGRHGSRWLIDGNQYVVPVTELEKGERNGKLTQRGRQLLAHLRTVKLASTKRLGELSDKGAEQHQRIARRMYENFPEVFAGDAPIDARSTVVIRCILSMQNETDMLKSLNPNLRITTDASNHDMYYMNCHDTVVARLRREVAPLYEDFRSRHLNPKHMLGVLFTDKKFVADSIDGLALMTNLYEVAANLQSHHAFDGMYMLDVFSDDELFELWSCTNVDWYLKVANTPLTDHRVVYCQRNLLTDFIEAADRALALGRNSATLRFGHDSVVLPTACLMGINGADFSTDDLEEVADNWCSTDFIPMAGNIQLVYYRKAGSDDVLVKVLMNEREATLPITTDIAPYYHWSEVRAYFMDVLADMPR